MDLRLILDSPTTKEKQTVDALVEVLAPERPVGDSSRVAYGGHQARELRHLLLPALHAVQDEFGGISRGALGYISEVLTVPPAEAFGVATFYSLFDVDGSATTTIEVCDDIVCSREGALRPEDGAEVVTRTSPCLGQCDRAPAALVRERGGTRRIVTATGTGGLVVSQDRADLRLLRRVGATDPGSIDSYLRAGGYAALTKVLDSGSESLLDALEESGLRGRGGAAFPIGAKWRSVAERQEPVKYVVANGDESEPGTFKDRVLMEGDPFAVIEGLTIAGLTVGADKGFIYVRGEYPIAEERLREAVHQARRGGFLGSDIAGSGLGFDIEVRRGAGAYVCGEETALFASIEGYRGEPRQKPPFPTEVGLFEKPTVVNNIETLAAVLQVIELGPAGFSAIGTSESTGPKLFCLSGALSRPGLYEFPLGITLGELIEGAGGIAGGGAGGAILVGGAAGTFVGPASLDLEMSFEGARRSGISLGSGAVVVFDDSTDFPAVLMRIARFFRDESCGQCVPCRIGTVRQVEALARLETGRTLGTQHDEMERLGELAAVMSDASICGLGQTASSAVQSALALGLIGGGP